MPYTSKFNKYLCRMLDKDSQLIYEAYVTERDSGETRIADVTPLGWVNGDVVTLRIGGLDVQFQYRSYTKDKDGKYYINLIPVKDYSSSGALPNIGTGDEGSNILYTNQRPINIESDVVKGRKPNQHGHSTKVTGYKPSVGGAAGGGTSSDIGRKPGKTSTPSQQRWTQDADHKHSFRAAAADWKPFERSDVKTMPMKWVGHRLEKGWQNLLAPKSSYRRDTTSRFATDPSKRYDGPESGQQMYVGSKYADAPDHKRVGTSKFKTS